VKVEKINCSWTVDEEETLVPIHFSQGDRIEAVVSKPCASSRVSFRLDKKPISGMALLRAARLALGCLVTFCILLNFPVSFYASSTFHLVVPV